MLSVVNPNGLVTNRAFTKTSVGEEYSPEWKPVTHIHFISEL